VPGDLIAFLLPVCGALAFALLVHLLVLGGGDPPAPPAPEGGAKVGVRGPSAGPDDLARSA
jgi:hypothetical protein